MSKHRESPISEITLRRYEKPKELSKRDLAKRICLALGVLQPGDSRDVVVDILYILMESKQPISAEEIVSSVKELRKNHKLPLAGVAHSNVRRQIRRLRNLMIAEKTKNKYHISENGKISHAFDEKTAIMLNSISGRIREYLEKADEAFNR